jgi:hypothetical protein
MTTAVQKRPMTDEGEPSSQTIAEFIKEHGHPQQHGDVFAFPDGASIEISNDGTPIFSLPTSIEELAASIEEQCQERAANAAREADARRMELLSRPNNVVELAQQFLRDRESLERCDDGSGRIFFEDGSVHVVNNVWASDGPPADVIERTQRIRRFRELKLRQAKARFSATPADRDPRGFALANRQLAQAESAYREVDILFETLCCIKTTKASPAERELLIQRRLAGQPIKLEFYEGPDPLVMSRLVAAKPWA